MKEKLASLHALQQLDTAIDAIKRELAHLDPGRAERKAYEEAKATLAQHEAQIHTLESEVRVHELEQQSIKAKYVVEEKKGATAKSKELSAIMEELEMFKRQLARLDEKLLELAAAIETERTHEANAKAELKVATRALKTKQDEYKVRAEELANQGRALTVQRKEAVEKVAPSLLPKYDKMRTNMGGMAVAAIIEGGSCEGCRMKLPSSLVVAVKNQKEMVTCDNCHRILVLGE